MSPGNDNQIDWTAAATPAEGVVPSLSRQALSHQTLSRQTRARVLPQTKRNVMDTLLGKNNLTASDAGGADPYNATGRQFRR
jgi:hypothetical protein